MSARVSVSLPTRDRPRILGRCIAALLKQTYPGFEVWIVYDGEPVVHPETAYYLQLLARDHRLIEIRGTGYGQVYAHNLVLYQSGAEFILRLDDDVLLHQRALEKMVNFLDTHPDVGAVSGLWFDSGERRTLLPETLKRFMVGGVDTSECVAQVYYHPTNAPYPVEHLYSACLYRAQDMRRVGGWPMIYSRGVHHREETDGTYRLMLSGKKLFVLPDVTGQHLRTETGGIRNDPNWFGKQELDDRLFREERLPSFVQREEKPKVAVWSEHSISIAGGERHFYATVAALQESDLFNVWYFGKEGMISREDIKKYHGLELLPNPRDEPSEFDLQINISHFGITWKKAKNYMAMILFPGLDLYHVDNFVRLYGNSKFTAHYIKQAWGRDAGVIYPPPADITKLKKKNLMVVVGWFSPKKGLMSAIKAFVKAGLDDWKLVIFGDKGFEPKYEEMMRREAARYPNIEIRKKILHREAQELLGSAKILGGFGGITPEVPEDEPFYAEHFGLTPGEAMRVGGIPILFNNGGYPESCNRFLFKDIDEAADLIREIASWSPEEFERVSKEMMEEGQKFSYDRFKNEIIDACLQILYGGITKDSPYTIGEPREDNLKPKVSVVIPNYNLERYLPEAIESTLSQTRRDFETIVVDDGSEGDTEAVVRDCGLGRITFVRQENQGLPAARNTGIKVADGEFILPLDSDDFLASQDVLEKLVPIAEKNLHSILYSDVVLQYAGRTELLELREYDFNALLTRDFIPPTALFLRQAWVESGGYKDFGPGFEDWEFWITLGELQYFGVKVDFPIYHYRQRTGSMRDEANKIHDELFAKIKALHTGTYAAPLKIPTYTQAISEFMTVVYQGQTAPHTVRGPVTFKSYRIRSGKPVSMVSADAMAVLKLFPNFVLVEGA